MRQAKKEFQKRIRALSSSRHVWEIFRDFCELSALSLANSLRMDAEREQRYMNIIGRYDKDEAHGFAGLLGDTILALEDNEAAPTDFLGDTFMELELSSHWHGQFFTPMPLCSMMASLNLEGLDEKIEQQGYVTLQEPSCGAGAMVIAFAAAMREAGYNPQQQLHVVAIDVDQTAAYMAYIQFFLLGIPAVVHVGNTLSLEMRERLDTLMHVAGWWDVRLAARHLFNDPPPENEPAPEPQAQAELNL